MTQASPSGWRPLLRDEAADRALGAAEAIAAGIARWVARADAGASGPAGFEPGPSLGRGLAGLALFLAYLDAAVPGHGYGEEALGLLERAGAGIATIEMPPSLYGGFSGVGWTAEHLGRLLGAAPAAAPEAEAEDDSGAEVAAAIERLLRQTPWQGAYDLISGLVGLGVYAVERMPRSGAAECLELVVERLGEIAERPQPGFVRWRTPREWLAPELQERSPDGLFDLGVAHGVPGVIGFLGQACGRGVATGRARPLLEGAVAWLLAQRLPADAPWRFPATVTPGRESRRSRLAWCYGDLGIAAVLLATARATGDASWEREALALARTAAGYRMEGSGVVDAGLCHGTAGLAHLFNRLFQASGDPVLADASRLWYDRTFDLQRPGEGVGGFATWTGPPGAGMGWQDQPGFLAGAAGVGLALVAGAVAIEPAWDRLLLTAIPPRPGG
jgi:hypothetical protein